MRVMSSAAMVTWALSPRLQLSIKHGCNVHTELCKALEIPHNCTDFCHGSPEAAHVPSSPRPLKQERETGSQQRLGEAHWLWICHHSLWHPTWKKHASSDGWITISAATHSSACTGNWLPASLPRSCSPNYTDHPTLKLNFPNCYINIKLRIEEWYTQNRGN